MSKINQDFGKYTHDFRLDLRTVKKTFLMNGEWNAQCDAMWQGAMGVGRPILLTSYIATHAATFVYTYKSLRIFKVCSRDNICWTIGDDLIVTNSSWDKNSVIWPRKVDRDTHPIID